MFSFMLAGSAWWMMSRIRWTTSPRQSLGEGAKMELLEESMKERVKEPREVEEKVEEEVVAGFRINAGDQGESRDLREEVKLQLLPASAPGMRKRICLIAIQI